jgi:hypothetical protein
MGAPDRGLAYLELPSEQLTASTPSEFAQLLNRVLTAAGMKASAVAIKVGKGKIPRSQAYSMVSATRTTLPSKPEQVRDFLGACRLAPLQVAMVMQVWATLDRQARETQQALERPAEAPPRTFDEEAPRAPRPSEHEVVIDKNVRRFLHPTRPLRADPVISYRPNAFVDLMSLVLESDARTRRALRLLIPLMLGFITVIAIFTAWAVLQPSHFNLIAGIFAVGFLVPITTLMRGVVRTRR